MRESEIRDLCIERTWRRARKYLGEGRIKKIYENDDNGQSPLSWWRVR